MDVTDLATAVAESTLSTLERVRFLNMCEARSVEMLAEDRDRVEGHLSLVLAAQTINPVVDIELAEKIARSLLSLLDDRATLGFEERRLLAGAVEYYVLSTDIDNDLDSAIGLVDDARVANATAVALNRPDLVISIGD
ncbi:MAG: hypothetical protein GY720_19540 [bacterium]|nr:hypothetical protein [bacterium]